MEGGVGGIIRGKYVSDEGSRRLQEAKREASIEPFVASLPTSNKLVNK